MCFCRYFVSLSQVRYEHPHQKDRHPYKGVCLFDIEGNGARTHLNAARASVAADGLTEANIYFAPMGAKCKSSPVTGTKVQNPLFSTGFGFFSFSGEKETATP